LSPVSIVENSYTKVEASIKKKIGAIYDKCGYLDNNLFAEPVLNIIPKATSIVSSSISSISSLGGSFIVALAGGAGIVGLSPL